MPQVTGISINDMSVPFGQIYFPFISKTLNMHQDDISLQSNPLLHRFNVVKLGMLGDYYFH